MLKVEGTKPMVCEDLFCASRFTYVPSGFGSALCDYFFLRCIHNREAQNRTPKGHTLNPAATEEQNNYCMAAVGCMDMWCLGC